VIPAIIAPAFIVPSFRPSPKELWAQYDGSLDGVFQDVSTYGGNPGQLASVGSLAYNADLNRGVVRANADAGLLQMFRIASPLAAERLGDQILHSVDSFDGEIEFTESDQRIWLPFLTDATPDNMRVEFAEYDSNGLTQIGGTETDPIDDSSINSNRLRSVVTDLDSTRAIWAYLGGLGMRVAVLTRSGGTLLTTVNSVLYGSGIEFTDFEGARPLNASRSLALFPTNTSAPFSIDAQGCAHPSDTPSQVGTAATVTTNARRFGVRSGPYARLSRCLDGLGLSKGRFLFGWIDDTTSTISLRCIQYDEATDTVSMGATIDVGSGDLFTLVTLGSGIVALVNQPDPTSSPGGFRIVEYNDSDVDDLEISMGAGGLNQVAKDGFLTGHPAGSITRGFAISPNRFGIAVGNSFDGSVNVKVVHNGGDSFI